MNYNPDIIETNRALLSGDITAAPKFSHKAYGEAFCEARLGVKRSSGYVDEIRIQISERLINGAELCEGTHIEVRGQVRTYNEEADGRSRLNVIVFVRELKIIPDGEAVNYDNDIYLAGHICKQPVRRTSPLGREICDIMLAVNRMYNKSDYIPCIAWGRNAAYSGTLTVGDELVITGRMQSREYRKKDDEGNCVLNTAYEVSIVKIDG